MLKRLLLTLRRKPKYVRDQVAFGIASGFTALVLIVWLGFLPERFSQTATVVEPTTNNLSSFVDELQEQIEKTQEELSTSPTTTGATQPLPPVTPVSVATTTPTASVSTPISPVSTPTTSTPTPRIVRIATTSQSTSTPPQAE